MSCPCPDGKGNIIEVSAKTKEMVYRAQAPWIQEAIKKDITSTVGSSGSSTGRGRGK